MFPIRDHNPSLKTPYVTYAIIAMNVAVFLLSVPLATNQAALGAFYSTFAMIPERVSAGAQPYTLVTSLFLHGGLMHLAGNMLFLWIFGDNLEDELGHAGFTVFYLLCGVGASLAQILAQPASPVPMVGASGAIAGVMGGYLLLFPRARVDVLFIFLIFFRIFPVPAWIMLGVWFTLQLFSGSTIDTANGGVAYWAHAGGFVIGFLYLIPAWLRRGGATYWHQTRGRPPHPEANYPLPSSRVPRVRRRK